MSHQNERFSISFSQDEHATRVVVSLPTKTAKAGMQKALLFLTSSGIFWVSSHLPIAILPNKPPSLPETQPMPTQVQPPL